MSDVVSFLCNCATPATIESLADQRGFIIFQRSTQPSICCPQIQYHGYVDNPEDDYDGSFGFLVPGHRTFDYSGRNGLHMTKEKRVRGDHFNGYSWFRLGNLKGEDVRQFIQYQGLAIELPARFGY